MLTNRSIHHKLILTILWSRASSLLHLSIYPVHSLTKLFHQLMVAHIERNFRITRKMHLSDIIRSNQTRQYAWTLHRHMVVKKLHLDVRS